MNTALTIEQLITKFLLQKDIAPSSRKTYRGTIHSFFKWMVFKNYKARVPKREHIVEYKSYLIEQNKSNETVSLYLNSLKSFFSWTEELKIYPNVAAKIKAPKRFQGYKRQRLSIDEVSLLLNSIDRKTISGKRDFCMILFAFTNGLRTIELSRLKVKHLDFGIKKALIQRKGHQQPMKWLSISNDVSEAIEQYLKAKEQNGDDILPSSSVFTSHKHHCKTKSNPLTAQEIGVIISKRLKQCNLKTKQITAHSLRHTAASILLELNWNVHEIKEFLGHSSVTTTEIYLKSANLVNLHAQKPQDSLSNLLQE